MKNIYNLTLIIIAILQFSCTSKSEDEIVSQNSEPAFKIRIKGSETVRPIIEKIDDDYMNNNPNVFVDYQGGGSNMGLLAFMEDEADIAFISRELTEDEKNQIRKKDGVIDTLAIDGLAIIINVSNPIKTLSLQQLSDIYSGKTTNWKDVGGNNWPIILYSRDISSGTYSFFKDKVLGTQNYSNYDINITHNDEIISNVSTTKNAIGYVGLLYSHKSNIKPLNIIFDEKQGPQTPNFQNIIGNTYRLKRYIVLVYKKDSKEEIISFIKDLKKESTLKIINESGLIPVGKL